MKKLLTLVATASLMFSCTQEETVPEFDKIPINISMGIQSRANDATYENGDEVGIYVVNHNGSTGGVLNNQDYQVNNMRFTFNEGYWTPDESIFWKDKNTATDFYAYYPYSESVNISAHPFSVITDQSTEENFWSSDFLWGKTSNVLPTPLAVPIKTNHLLSRILVDIKAGNGFTDETWASATKSIKICGMQTSGTIDLLTGIATATGDKSEIIPLNTTENNYQAMVIPQLVEDGAILIVVTVDGIDYVYRKGYEFKANTQHKFTITINKTDGSVDIAIGEWDIDETENNDEATEYYFPNSNQIWYTSTDGAIIELDENAFENVKITANSYKNGKGIITFDNDLISLTKGTFTHNDNLVSISLPNSITNFGGGEFQGCLNLKEFKSQYASADRRCLIIDGVLTSFAPSGITSYTIPYNVSKIGAGSFAFCETLESISINESVTEIGAEAFFGAGIKKFEGKFASEDGSSLIVDGKLITYAINSEIKSYTIPENVTSIGACAFNGTRNLEEITIHENVKVIEVWAFRDCEKLKNVYCKATTPPSLQGEVFQRIDSSAKIYVPIGSGESYRTADNWKDYATIIEEREM